MERSDIRIGQKIWFRQQYAGILSGYVTAIHQNTSMGLPLVTVLLDEMDECNDLHSGTFDVIIENIFESYEEAKEYNKREFNKEVQRYSDTIRSVKDIVRFPLDHSICYTDEECDERAREAYKRRTKELLNIEL